MAAIGLTGKVPGKRRLPHDPRLALDGNLDWLGARAALSDPDVAVALIQAIYKTIWLLVFALPRLLGGRISEVPWGIALTFFVIVVSYPWVIPWNHLFGQ